jgi:glycosyltransferase involved in cell wall biosynthesis
MNQPETAELEAPATVTSPLVTVVIPAYNAERTLAQTLASIASQTVQDLEVIVVDDGSTDATTDVANGFPDLDVLVHPQANAGHAAARNAGTEAARGRWVAFVDADDLWIPTKLELQLGWLERHAPARAVQGGSYIIDDQLNVLSTELCRPSRDQLGNALRLRNMPALMSTLIVERDLLNEIGGFDDTLPILQDWDLAIRLARVGEFHSLAAPVSGYRTHPSSQSRNVGIHVEAGRRVLDKVFADPNVSQQVRRQRREVEARFHLMLCGGEMRYGTARGTLRWGVKALVGDPRTSVPMLAMPLRSRRRRRSALAARASGGWPGSEAPAASQRPTRVLHFISDSGALEFFDLMRANTDRRRVHMHVATLEPPGRLHTGMAEHGIPTLSLESTRRSEYPRAAIRLARWLRGNRIDVLQLHLFEASIVGTMAAKLARTPVVVYSGHHSHEVPLHNRRALLEVDRAAARLADRVVAPSPQMRRTFIDVHRCTPDRVEFIPHGSDLARFDPGEHDGHAFRAEQGLEGKFVIGAVSRFYWVKNLPALITAFAQLAAGDPSYELVLVGGSGDTTELLAAARANGVDDRVRILTGRTDMPDVLAAFDMFVHPALAESFGYVIIEAMAMQLPVVSTRVGIAEEVITDGLSGVLIDGSDPESVRTAVERMLDLRGRWPEIGSEARQRALQFTPDKWVARHELGYEEWLAGSLRSRA